MSHISKGLAVVAVLAASACTDSAPQPSPFSNAVHTDSGISATGSAGTAGGPAAAPSGAGSLTTPRTP